MIGIIKIVDVRATQVVWLLIDCSELQCLLFSEGNMDVTLQG